MSDSVKPHYQYMKAVIHRDLGQYKDALDSYKFIMKK